MKNPSRMLKGILLACSMLLWELAVSGLAKAEEAKPAPAGFNNVTNGFRDQKKFDADRKAFEDVETILPENKSASGRKANKSRHGRALSSDSSGDTDTDSEAGGGLGPVYNATSCVSCHQNPVTGSSSQISEIRAGRREGNEFVEPPGGSLIHQRAIDAQIQEHVRDIDDVRTLRMSTNILGNGFVEVIPDDKILEFCKSQPEKGLPIPIPVAVRVKKVSEEGEPEEFDFVLRLGRFGWKTQEASLLNFSAGAYLNEMGITSPLQPTENTSNGRDVTQFDPVADPEDEAKPKAGIKKPKEHKDFEEPFGEDVGAFARFMRSTRVPPRDFAVAQGEICKDPFNEKEKNTLKDGEKVFSDTGCHQCHRPQYTTPPAGTPIKPLLRLADSVPGTDFGIGDRQGVVPEALGNKKICPFSDFMLHDIGTGDGIVQTQHAQLPPKTAIEFLRQVEQEEPARIQSVAVDRCDWKQHLAKLHKTAENRQELAVTQSLGVRKLDQTTAQEIRTAPLWGLRVRSQLMHDGLSLTIEDAILRHGRRQDKEEEKKNPPQGKAARENFEKLSQDDKRALLIFLNSL